jgi:hypothetical protein
MISGIVSFRSNIFSTFLSGELAVNFIFVWMRQQSFEITHLQIIVGPLTPQNFGFLSTDDSQPVTSDS